MNKQGAGIFEGNTMFLNTVEPLLKLKHRYLAEPHLNMIENNHCD